jgi:hypothetical protein
VLEGLPSLYFSGSPITQSHHLSGLLTVTVAGTLVGQSGAVTKEAAAAWFGIPRPPLVDEQVTFLPPNKRRSPEKIEQLKRCMSNSSANLGYTSRPLNGIWATAPYLHNGSVPTLNDLLLPANERPRKFYMGTRQYDPKNVGYLTNEDAPGNSFLFETHDSDGDEIDGNSNAGHDYSNGQLTEEMRRAIIEYLKTL